MPNILLNNYCNRRCPYCFAKQRLQGQSQNLSLAELARILKFFKQSDIKRFSLLGGEPTLNPEFKQLAQRVLDEGFPLSLFTNGLISPEVLGYLTGEARKKLSGLVNINHPDDNKPAEWEWIGRTLEALGDRTGLGYNVYKSRPDLEFLIETIDKYKLNKYVRISMTQPILKVDNAYLPLEDYAGLAKTLVDFAARCDKFDIKLAFDCGFILCMFNEEQLGRLYLYNVELGFYCTPAVDIGPGLEIWRCFPLSYSYNRNLDEFKAYKQIDEFYQQKFSPFNKFGSLPKCANCKYLHRGQCSGGCLSHKMKAFHI